MPTVSSSDGFKTLYDKYSNDSLGQAKGFITALRLPLSGYAMNGHSWAAGASGAWWSSIIGNYGTMYLLSVNTSEVYPGSYSSREYGRSVRCVLDVNPGTVTSMQDFTSTSIATLLPDTGDIAMAYDARDGQNYTIAKLADGRYWMTKNLNLAGGTKIESTNSDVPSGYTESNPYYILPSSSTFGFSDNSVAYVYNSGRTACTSNSYGSCYSYYSWIAATAGGKDVSGNTIITDGHNAEYSICPKGWKLPTASTGNASPTSNNNWKTGDWYALATAYGANLESSTSDSSTATGGKFYAQAGPGTVAGFLLAGAYYNGNGTFSYGDSYGFYWSRTSDSGMGAYYLNFSLLNVASVSLNPREYGYSVRCVFGS